MFSQAQIDEWVYDFKRMYTDKIDTINPYMLNVLVRKLLFNWSTQDNYYWSPEGKINIEPESLTNTADGAFLIIKQMESKYGAKAALCKHVENDGFTCTFYGKNGQSSTIFEKGLENCSIVVCRAALDFIARFDERFKNS